MGTVLCSWLYSFEIGTCHLTAQKGSGMLWLERMPLMCSCQCWCRSNRSKQRSHYHAGLCSTCNLTGTRSWDGNHLCIQQRAPYNVAGLPSRTDSTVKSSVGTRRRVGSWTTFEYTCLQTWYSFCPKNSWKGEQLLVENELTHTNMKLPWSSDAIFRL